MVRGTGPTFPEPLRSPADLLRLARPDVHEALGYVFEALTRTRLALDGRVPLIGFAGAPWTLMAYMIEGGGSKTFSRAKTWLFAFPDESHRLLALLTDVVIEYLCAQIEAGAQVVQVFDTWAGQLGPEAFATFGLPYLKRIGTEVGARCPGVPRIAFARGAHYATAALAGAGFDALSLDWTMDPRTARREVGPSVTLQGNLDPCALYAPPRVIADETRRMLEAFGPDRHIANLGHGMHPDHDPEHARAFIDAVHDLSAGMR